MKVILSGANGRMGREIAQLVKEMAGWEVIAGVDRNASSQLDFPLFVGFSKGLPSKADVLIDFSLPELGEQAFRWAEKNAVPVVSGTTGLDEKQLQLIKTVSQTVPILWSPNMSLGVAWFRSVMSTLSALEGFDFQIEETHHRLKKDRPSGTALFLQEALEKAVGPTPQPLSIRGGGIFGIHKLHAMSSEETISIEHTALNRTVFARGAIQAAAWLVHQSSGQYELSNIFDSKSPKNH